MAINPTHRLCPDAQRAVPAPPAHCVSNHRREAGPAGRGEYPGGRSPALTPHQGVLPLPGQGAPDGAAEGGWQNSLIRLEPLNKDFQPILLRDVPEGEIQAIAEFLEILAPLES